MLNKLVEFCVSFFYGKIKGNVKSNGDKIYHVPGGSLYDYVKAEKRFRTEEAAQKAGFRKSKR